MCSCHYPRMLCHVFWSQVEYKIVCFIIIDNNEGLINQIIQAMLCNILKILDLDNTKRPKSMISEPITDHSHSLQKRNLEIRPSERLLFIRYENPLKTANFKVYSAVLKEP